MIVILRLVIMSTARDDIAFECENEFLPIYDEAALEQGINIDKENNESKLLNSNS